MLTNVALLFPLIPLLAVSLLMKSTFTCGLQVSYFLFSLCFALFKQVSCFERYTCVRFLLSFALKLT